MATVRAARPGILAWTHSGNNVDRTAGLQAPRADGFFAMVTYRAPIDDIVLALNQGGGLLRAVRDGHYGSYDAEMTVAVLEEAGRFAEDVLAPLNAVGDKNGVKIEGNKVTTPPGWADAYRRWS